MARGKKTKEKAAATGARLGFEEKLWQAADKMRGHVDAFDKVKLRIYVIYGGY